MPSAAGSRTKKAVPAPKGKAAIGKGKKTVLDSRVRRAEAGKLVYSIDCSIPAADGLLDQGVLEKFVTYLQEKIKVGGKAGNLGDKVAVASGEDGRITVTKKQVLFPKKYIKFLIKKFLRREKLRDYFRAVSTKKGEYQLRYFNIHLKDSE